MSVGELNVIKRGYEARLNDQEKIAIEIGYWSGYYSRAKRPKSPQVFIKKMERARSSSPKPTVDMDLEIQKFKEREARLKKCRTT